MVESGTLAVQRVWIIAFRAEWLVFLPWIPLLSASYLIMILLSIDLESHLGVVSYTNRTLPSAGGLQQNKKANQVYTSLVDNCGWKLDKMYWASEWCIGCGPHLNALASAFVLFSVSPVRPRLSASFCVELNVFMTICSRFDCEITKRQFMVFVSPTCSHVCGNKPPLKSNNVQNQRLDVHYCGWHRLTWNIADCQNLR